MAISTNFADMQMEKVTIKKELHALLESRLIEMNNQLESLKASRSSADKSTAGDKHEVGRAMMQEELDRIESRIVVCKRMMQEAERMPVSTHTTAAWGSLLETSMGWIYLSVPAGKLHCQGQSIMCISTDSPLGQFLQGHRAGEKLSFRSTTVVLMDVS